MIIIKNLFKKFGNQTVLKGIDTKINKGEIVAVLGASGSGKSTLLRCINRMEVPCEGEIFIDEIAVTDQNIHSIRSKAGMVFQNFNLFPHMTVLENLMYAPLKIRKMPRPRAQEKALALLKQVGLQDKAGAYPQKLSGGEKQRVAIARTLMMDPEIILFDEPTSSLDPEMVQEVLKVIKSLASTGITMLIVTHEMGFVKEVSDRVLFLDQGKIIADQKTEEFLSAPQSSRILSFLN